ncbi:hypothetical protein IAQ61_001745 [Plenodomus lingam]|uniref:uncharacterized protein n=1 Tax=Leptosphaeria maculans TaxID=5022 RepID=UPI00332F443B|nr:hypothetical protein IAQ61_001745 [Plenodomus lingam]
MQTREDEVENVTAGQRIWTAEKMQCSQAPVEAVETQMFSEPVLELVFALGRVSTGTAGRTR